MPYLDLIDERGATPTVKSRKIKKKGRGRRKLLADPTFLDNRFGDDANLGGISSSKCPLKLYFEFEDMVDSTKVHSLRMFDFQRKLKVVADPKDYPYDLPFKCNELEIVHINQCLGDDIQNNTKDLYSGPLKYLNDFE